MKFRNEILESSLSRIYSQSKKHDSGTISAFRSAKNCNTGEVFTKSENKQNSRTLNAKLLKMGYGVTKIDGTYIENYKTSDEKEVKEESYIVVDIKDKGTLKKDLIKLGVLFEQDSITFQEKDGDYYLISSNTCEKGYPGSGKVGVEVKLGKPIYGKSGEFHSKVNGRPFIFETVLENFEVLTEKSISEIRSADAFSKFDIIK